MTTVVLRQGESVRVEMDETDGSFEVTYGLNELTVTSDMPGSHVGGEGLIYREVFAGCTCDGYMLKGIPDPRCPEHGKYAAKDVTVAFDEEEGPRFDVTRTSRDSCEVRLRRDGGLFATFHGPEAEAAANAWAAAVEDLPVHFQSGG